MAGAVVDLGEQLDITVAAAIQQRLLAGLTAEQPIELDGGRLQRVDTAGVQLLVAFARAAQSGPGWYWKEAPPPVVLEAASWLGLGAELSGDGAGNQSKEQGKRADG